MVVLIGHRARRLATSPAVSALVLTAVVGATVAAYALAVRNLHQDTRQSMSDLATSWSVALDSLAESADAEFTAVASAISGGHTERFDEGLASVPADGGVGDIESAVLLTRRGERYEVVRSARSEPKLLPPLRAPLAGPLGRVDEREGSVALASRTANLSLRIGFAYQTELITPHLIYAEYVVPFSGASREASELLRPGIDAAVHLREADGELREVFTTGSHSGERATYDLDLGSMRAVLELSADASVVSPLVRNLPWIVLGAGLALAVLLAGIVDAARRRHNSALGAARQLEQANERLREASRDKDEFVSTVSHELRTPLTAIRGFATTMLEHWPELDDTTRRTLLHRIEQQASRQARLVDDLLTMSRLLTGGAEPVIDEVDVCAATTEVLEAVATSELWELECPAGATVAVDSHHLQQVLANLITNATKYGQPPYRIRVRPSGEHLEIAVVDNGPGVPPDFEEDLFQRFRQASRGDARTGQGVGLGLAIVKSLVQANGGDIWYAPGRDRGASFVVRLPAVRTRTTAEEHALTGV